jgi:DNA repair ATPase RecN
MFPYIIEQFRQMNRELAKIMASQDDINAAVTAIQGLLTDLSAQAGTILTDIQAVQSQIGSGQAVDTSALDSAVSGIQAVQTSLDSAVSNLTTVAEPTPATPTDPTTPTS